MAQPSSAGPIKDQTLYHPLSPCFPRAQPLGASPIFTLLGGSFSTSVPRRPLAAPSSIFPRPRPPSRHSPCCVLPYSSHRVPPHRVDTASLTPPRAPATDLWPHTLQAPTHGCTLWKRLFMDSRAPMRLLMAYRPQCTHLWPPPPARLFIASRPPVASAACVQRRLPDLDHQRVLVREHHAQGGGLLEDGATGNTASRMQPPPPHARACPAARYRTCSPPSARRAQSVPRLPRNGRCAAPSCGRSAADVAANSDSQILIPAGSPRRLARSSHPPRPRPPRQLQLGWRVAAAHLPTQLGQSPTHPPHRPCGMAVTPTPPPHPFGPSAY